MKFKDKDKEVEYVTPKDFKHNCLYACKHTDSLYGVAVKTGVNLPDYRIILVFDKQMVFPRIHRVDELFYQDKSYYLVDQMIEIDPSC